MSMCMATVQVVLPTHDGHQRYHHQQVVCQFEEGHPGAHAGGVLWRDIKGDWTDPEVREVLANEVRASEHS